MCANTLYRGGPKTLLTDQHLLRTNLFFVTETSELRLAGLSMLLMAYIHMCVFLFMHAYVLDVCIHTYVAVSIYPCRGIVLFASQLYAFFTV